MKTIVAILSLLTISSTSMSMQVDFRNFCRVNTSQNWIVLNLLGTPYITTKDSLGETREIPIAVGKINNGEEIQINVLRSREESRKYDDGCYVGKITNGQKLIEIEAISEELAESTGLHKNEMAVLNCSGTVIRAVGNHCSKQKAK